MNSIRAVATLIPFMLCFLITSASAMDRFVLKTEEKRDIEEIEQELLKATEANLKIIGAASLEDINLLIEALAEGADPNHADQTGATPLHHAARNGRTSAVELLLDNGADVDSVDSTGRTPLIEAAAKGDMESVRHLLNRGADLTKSCRDGKTALYEARYYDQMEMFHFLGELQRAEDAKMEQQILDQDAEISRMTAELEAYRIELETDLANRERYISELEAAAGIIPESHTHNN